MEEFIWSEKYRPKKVDDVILPERIKNMFKGFVEQGDVPNLILAGGSGVGKTTMAKAVLDEIGCNYIVINASLDRNIDTLRYEIMDFATTVSLTGGRKYVILDEAEYLNPQSFQPALRGFMQDFSKNCGFILTCNSKNKIIEPIKSRCTVIDFHIEKKELPKIAGEFMKRFEHILNEEGVEYNKKVLAQVIKSNIPDWRKAIGFVQSYSSANGSVDEGILTNLDQKVFDQLYSYMKNKNNSSVRKWIAENSDIEADRLYSTLYEDLPSVMKGESSIAATVDILAKYQYQEYFVANSEINRAAAIQEIMANAEFV